MRSASLKILLISFKYFQYERSRCKRENNWIFHRFSAYEADNHFLHATMKVSEFEISGPSMDHTEETEVDNMLKN